MKGGQTPALTMTVNTSSKRSLFDEVFEVRLAISNKPADLDIGKVVSAGHRPDSKRLGSNTKKIRSLLARQHIPVYRVPGQIVQRIDDSWPGAGKVSALRSSCFSHLHTFNQDLRALLVGPKISAIEHVGATIVGLSD